MVRSFNLHDDYNVDAEFTNLDKKLTKILDNLYKNRDREVIGLIARTMSAS